jgi:hypothetical protein
MEVKMEFENGFPPDDIYAAEYVDEGDLSPNIDETDIRQRIHKSILEAGKHTHPHLGVTYYLNPIDGCIEPWLETGGIPKNAYHGIWVKIMTAPADAIPESVVNALLRLEDQLVYDCEENFRGTEWDGNNYIGIWGDKPNYPFEYELEVGVFWDPEDWFDVYDLQRIQRKWKEEGMTAAQIIDSEDLGDHNGKVRRDDAIQWLQNLIEQWEEEEEDA